MRVIFAPFHCDGLSGRRGKTRAPSVHSLLLRAFFSGGAAQVGRIRLANGTHVAVKEMATWHPSLKSHNSRGISAMGARSPSPLPSHGCHSLDGYDLPGLLRRKRRDGATVSVPMVLSSSPVGRRGRRSERVQI